MFIWLLQYRITPFWQTLAWQDTTRRVGSYKNWPTEKNSQTWSRSNCTLQMGTGWDARTSQQCIARFPTERELRRHMRVEHKVFEPMPELWEAEQLLEQVRQEVYALGRAPHGSVSHEGQEQQAFHQSCSWTNFEGKTSASYEWGQDLCSRVAWGQHLHGGHRQGVQLCGCPQESPTFRGVHVNWETLLQLHGQVHSDLWAGQWCRQGNGHLQREEDVRGRQAHCRDGHGSFAHPRHRGEQEQGWTKQLTSDTFKETTHTLGPTTTTLTASPPLGQVQGEQVRPLPGLLPCLQLSEPLHGEETPSASGRDSRHLLDSPWSLSARIFRQEGPGLPSLLKEHICVPRKYGTKRGEPMITVITERWCNWLCC